MKLIDFEKLMEMYNNKYKEFNVYDLRFLKDEHLPIVEAIPTSWLNEWYWNNSDVCCDKRVSALFGKMIRDWRIEKIRRLYEQKIDTNN